MKTSMLIRRNPISVALSLGLGASLLTGCGGEAQFTGPGLNAKPPKILADEEFKAGVIGENSVTYNPPFGTVEQTLTLKEKAPRISTLRQKERPVGTEQFKQGHDGNLADQTFEISEAGRLDLLIVIDDSGSMKQEQDKIKDKLQDLTTHLKKVDWQMAVITTSSPCLRNGGKVIKHDDDDPEGDFAEALDAGVNGHGNERGIEYALRAINGKITNYNDVIGQYCETKNQDQDANDDGRADWIRDNASLGVFFVSDEDSFCPTRGCDEGQRPQDLAQRLTEIHPAERVRSYALIWDKDYPNCSRDSSESYGGRYVDLIKDQNYSLGGLEDSICQDGKGYSKVLKRISKDVSRIVKREFELDHEPVTSSLEVMVDGKETMGYELDGKMLRLKRASPKDKTLKVMYRYGAVPKFDRVALQGDLDPSTLKAVVNGNKLSDSAWVYDEVMGKVFFDNMPPDEADVEIRYRKDEPLPTVFDVADLPLKEDGPLKVEVSGDSPAYTYDADTKTLDFASAPRDGAEVKVSYRGPDSEIVRYGAAPANLTDVQSLLAEDADTGDTLGVTLDGAELVFDESAVFEGRPARVVYDYGGPEKKLTYQLGETPLEGSLEVTDVGPGENCITGVTVEGRQVAFHCDDDEIGDVSISYEYLANLEREFTVETDAPNGPKVFWEVYVDGELVESFEREGNTIRIPDVELTADSKVRVVVKKEMPPGP